MTDFAATRALFHLSPGVIYLDGNSLGPLPLAAEARVAEVMRSEWGGELIKAWNSADWIGLPRRVGDRIGKLIGAPAGFIRRPFLYAGLWYGVSGGGVAIIAVYIARHAMAEPVGQLVALYEGAFSLRGPDPRLLLTVLGAGAVLGLAGAWLAVSRHLGRVEQR